MNKYHSGKNIKAYIEKPWSASEFDSLIIM